MTPETLRIDRNDPRMRGESRTSMERMMAEWRDAIEQLDAGLRDAASAQERIDDLLQALAREDAERTLATDGKNAEHRKAQLTLALAASPTYVANLTATTRARMDLSDAERRVTVARERCRLLQTCIGLYRSIASEMAEPSPSVN